MKKLARLLVLLVAIRTAAAQTPTAQITGLITDPTGAVVPAAEVEVANVDTGARWQAASTSSGYYTVPLLPPGSYRIVVQAAGFKSAARSGVSLVVAQVARIDFRLEVGAVTESVEVAASTSLVESQTASLGQIVETRTINDLPLNGRNYLALAKLTAGVVEPGGTTWDRSAAPLWPTVFARNSTTTTWTALTTTPASWTFRTGHTK